MIPGVTTKHRLPRLGKIRLGEKRISQGGKEYPAALDYFNLVDAAAVKSVLGDKPKDLFPILLPSNDIDAFWRTSRSAYGRGTGLFCRCQDGVTATRVYKGQQDGQGFAWVKEHGLDLDEGDLFDMPCAGDDCPFFEKKHCKNLASFDFFMPQVPGFGTWCIQTSSFNSIRNIESTLIALRDALGGQIAGIPLGLRLVPLQAQVEGKAKTVHVLELICPFNLQQLAGLRRRAIAAGGAAVALIEDKDPAPDDLYAFGGGSLEEALGGPKVDRSRLEPEPWAGKLDALAGKLKNGQKSAAPPAELDDDPGPGDDPGPAAPFGQDPAWLKADKAKRAAPAAAPPAQRTQPAQFEQGDFDLSDF